MPRKMKSVFSRPQEILTPDTVFYPSFCSGRLLGSSWLGGFPLEVTESLGPSFVMSKAVMHHSFNIKNGYYGPRQYLYGLKKENFFENLDCRFSDGGITTALLGTRCVSQMNPLITNRQDPYDRFPLPVFASEAGFSLRLPPHMFAPSHHSDMHVHMGNQLKDKIQNSSVNLGVQFATLNDTLNLLEKCTDIFLGAFKTTRARKSGIRVDSSLKDALGSAWLTWSYGFKPLIDDLFALVEDVSSGELEIPYSKNTARSRRHLSLDWDLRFKRSSRYPGYSWSNWYGSDAMDPPGSDAEWPSIPVVSRGTYDAGLTIVCTYDIRHTLSQLGISNPATWLWEIIPFSFVIDWFWKVGDMLSRLDALYGVEMRSAYFTERVKLLHECDHGSLDMTYYRRKPIFGEGNDQVSTFVDVFGHSFGSVLDYLSLSEGQVEDGTGLKLVAFKADGSFNTRLANALALLNAIFL